MDKPTKLPRSATNPAPALGYPRIVIESETHSLSPEIASGFEHSNCSDDAIEPVEDKGVQNLPLIHDKDPRIQKLRQTNLRTFGIRKSTRPLRKLRRQQRVSYPNCHLNSNLRIGTHLCWCFSARWNRAHADFQHLVRRKN